MMTITEDTAKSVMSLPDAAIPIAKVIVPMTNPTAPATKTEEPVAAAD